MKLEKEAVENAAEGGDHQAAHAVEKMLRLMMVRMYRTKRCLSILRSRRSPP